MKRKIRLLKICVMIICATQVQAKTWYVDTISGVAGNIPVGMQQWKAAAAAVKITPRNAKGSWMFGNASQTKPSSGVGQDIFAKALAIEDARGTRLVIVTYDLMGIPRTLRQSLSKRCADVYKLEPESLLLNASHTHSGPEVRLYGVNGDDVGAYMKDEAEAEAYGRLLEEKTFQIVGEVLQKLAPARLDYFHARAGFAMNRRQPTENGFTNAPYSDGPVDHNVPVLRVTTPGGEHLQALLFGYACHPTALVNSTLISGDYVGYASEYIEATHPGTIALFMQGCGGDQNPYPRHTPDFVKQHGRALANAVEAALFTVSTPLNGPLGVAFGEVALEYAPLPSRKELQDKQKKSEDEWERNHAKWVLELMDSDRVPASYPCPVQVVRFGDELVLVAVGGELVVDYAFRLKREFAGRTVWVAGYSNDVFSYIPSLRVLEEGGYEGGGCMVYGRTHPGPWAPSIEDRIVSKVLELDSQLKQGKIK